MYKFKIIVFDSNIKRFATLTHMIGPRQSNNGCLPARETEDPLAAKFEGLEALEQEGPVRPPSEDENLEALCCDYIQRLQKMESGVQGPWQSK